MNIFYDGTLSSHGDMSQVLGDIFLTFGVTLKVMCMGFCTMGCDTCLTEHLSIHLSQGFLIIIKGSSYPINCC